MRGGREGPVLVEEVSAGEAAGHVHPLPADRAVVVVLLQLFLRCHREPETRRLDAHPS